MKCDKVIDITSYQSINNNTAFFLDTNVLYWYTNPRFTSSKDLTSQAKIYYQFVDQLVDAGNPLFTSIYNLTELLNVIEKNEFDIYKKLHQDTPEITKKDFRRMQKERNKVKQTMSTTLNNVKGICKIIEFSFEYEIISSFVKNLTEHRCDIFDFSILKNCIDEEHLNVISDDNDFSTMEKIKLYTANPSSLPNM